LAKKNDPPGGAGLGVRRSEEPLWASKGNGKKRTLTSDVPPASEKGKEGTGVTKQLEEGWRKGQGR